LVAPNVAVQQPLDLDPRRRWRCHRDHPPAAGQPVLQQVRQQERAQVIGGQHQLQAIRGLLIAGRENRGDVQERIDMADRAVELARRPPHRGH